MTTFVIILTITFLLFGSLQTITQTFQLARKVAGRDHVERYFDHSYLLVLPMELGQALCLLPYLFQQRLMTKQDDQEIPVNIFVVFPGTILDICGGVLNNLGLVMSRDAGSFQMLTSSRMVWCGLLSIPVFRRNLKWSQWSGVAVIVLGLFVKASVMFPSIFPDYEDRNHCGDYSNQTSSDRQEAGEPPNEKHLNVIIGYVCIVLGQLSYACMNVYDENNVKKYRIPPLKAVGYKGVFGIFVMGLVLWPLYFIKIGAGSILLGTGPDHRLEDAIDGFTQIFSGSSSWLLVMILLYIISSGIFNFARLAINKEIGATTAAVLDNGRILLVWGFFLLPLGQYLCRVQGDFHYTAPIGLAILMIGMAVYQGVCTDLRDAKTVPA